MLMVFFNVSLSYCRIFFLSWNFISKHLGLVRKISIFSVVVHLCWRIVDLESLLALTFFSILLGLVVLGWFKFLYFPGFGSYWSYVLGYMCSKTGLKSVHRFRCRMGYVLKFVNSTRVMPIVTGKMLFFFPCQLLFHSFMSLICCHAFVLITSYLDFVVSVMEKFKLVKVFHGSFLWSPCVDVS